MNDLIYRDETLKDIEKIRHSAQMLDDTHRAGILMTGMHLCEKAVRNQPPAYVICDCCGHVIQVKRK